MVKEAIVDQSKPRRRTRQTPIEQARALHVLLETQGWTRERLADELAVSRMFVSRALGLLKLPDSVQNQVEQGRLAPSTAYELLKIDDPKIQVRLATKAVEQGLTRADLAMEIRSSARRNSVDRRSPSVRILRFGDYKVTLERKKGVESTSAAEALRAAVRHYESTEPERGPGDCPPGPHTEDERWS